MPPPEPDSSRRVRQETQRTGQAGPAASRQTTGSRQRPAPSSALAPSPTPLMPVPDSDDDHGSDGGLGRGRPDRGPTSDRAGRRQYRQRGEGRATPIGPVSSSEELVYLSGRVPRGLRDELHIRAIHDGRPVVELLRDAIRQYLDDHSHNRPQ
jgi:hypothetical protein